MWTTENLYFTSDTHWFHANIVKHCHRPFDSVAEMNEVLIQAWNDKVPKNGVVFHCGDLSFGRPEDTVKIMNRLNGTKYLIKGNHDKNFNNKLKKCFGWIKEKYVLKLDDGNRIVLSHCPFLTWDGSHRGTYHVHGHCHGTLKLEKTTRMDVGVDTREDFAPYSYQEVIDILSQREYKVVDHHG